VSVVEASVVVNASGEEVWQVVADPRNLPRWDHRIGRVVDPPDGGLKPGATYRTELHFLGVRALVPAEVEEVEVGEYSRIRLRGVLTATVETWLHELPGDRTHLSHRIEYRFRGGMLGELAAQTVGIVGASTLLRHGIEAQKRQIEARFPR
jgi:uncharacterized membrane protein